MSNMSNALAQSNKYYSKFYQGYTKDQLLKEKDRLEGLIRERYTRQVDWDDCFVSQGLNETALSVVNGLLNPIPILENIRINLNGFTVDIIDLNNVYLKNNDKNIDVYVQYRGVYKGKGARKYTEEIEEIINYITRPKNRRSIIAEGVTITN